MRSRKVLSIDSINANMKDCKYDVRGEIYLAAVKRTQEGKEVIYTNVGNPHALGQVPLTFGRQVLSLMMAPFLMDLPQINTIFPPDAIARAKLYLKNLKGGLGAYTDSKGNPYIRQEIADFITRQSGQPSNSDNIFISNGASEGKCKGRPGRQSHIHNHILHSDTPLSIFFTLFFFLNNLESTPQSDNSFLFTPPRFSGSDDAIYAYSRTK